MRSTLTTFWLCTVLAAPAAAQNAGVSSGELLKHLAGTWTTPEERTPRNREIDEQVFGRGAMDVRTVTLVVTATGDVTLQVRRSVVGAKGKVFAPSLMEVKARIGDPVTNDGGHLRPDVTVTSAEERYLDGDRERWPRNGTRMSLSLFGLSSNRVNMQLDTPDGRGAFGATLTPSAVRKT